MFDVLDRAATDERERQRLADFEADCRRRVAAKDEARRNSRPPVGWRRPPYNTPEFWQAYGLGWITDAQAEEIHAAYEKRQARARAASGTVAAPPRRWARQQPRQTRQYANPMSTEAARDPRLTPQAKALLQVIRARCGNGIETRTDKTTLADIMGRSVRSIQRYIQELVIFGYIASSTRSNERGSHVGLFIRLCQKVLPFWKDDRGLAEWLHEVGDNLPDVFDWTRPLAAPDTGYLFDFTGGTNMSPKNFSPNLNIIIGKWAPLLASLHRRKARL